MITMTRRFWPPVFTLLVLLLFTSAISAQSFFSSKEKSNIDGDANFIVPKQFDAFEVDETLLLRYLNTVPLEFTGRESEKTFTLPYPGERGSMEFTIVESPIMESGLASKFPNIKTYRGQGIDDPTAVMRLTISQKGVNAIILSQYGDVRIAPYFNVKSPYYMAYFSKEEQMTAPFECGNTASNSNAAQNVRSGARSSSGGALKTYRVAMAASGEYTAFHSLPNAANVPDGLAAIVVTLATVNVMYERDVNIRMILVANNDLIVFTNGASDPFSTTTNFDVEHQITLDNIIGNSSYDVGQLLHGAGSRSGFAPGKACENSTKGRAYTQSSSPVADVFDLVVRHEFGHMFSAAHSFNNSCSGASWGNPHSIEVGSGSTAMAYAGICSPNVQPNNDAYFHGVSMTRINDYITTGVGNGCFVPISNSNDAPVLNHQAPNRTIPNSTPFFLHTSATDPNGDALTYGIEQMDGETASMPPSNTATVGPAFRSFQPVTDTTTYFPRITEVFAGNSPQWEVLSTVARNYEFLMTVRDNNSAGGCFAQDTVNLSVDGTAGPFVITDPNGGGTYIPDSKIISWNVAGTSNAATVNCQKVKIYCYTDVPNDTRFLLAEDVDNDGSHTVILPNVQSANCRIAVVAEDNYFYDVSDANFTITIDGDLCGDALPISCGDLKGGNTTGATDADEEPACSGGPGSGGIVFNVGVWYTFTGSGDSMTVSTDNSGTDFDTELQLWRGACGALTCIGGDDDGGAAAGGFSSKMTFLSEADSSYYVYVDGHGTTTTGNYELSLDCKAPTNDLQANAIDIDCNIGSISGQTISATNTGEPASCGTSITAPGVWYSVDGIGADITLDLCGSPYDSKINVYEDTGSGLTCVIGEDDDFPNCSGDDPSVTFASEVGKTYLIYVQGFGATGQFTLNISCECRNLVTNTNDSGYGSLRENVACAVSGDTIRFDAGIDGDSIKLLSGQIIIDKDLVILGNGIGQTIIDGSLDNAARLLNITSGSNTDVRDITFQNGGGPSTSNEGGAISTNGNSKFVDCLFKHNIGTNGGAILGTFGELTLFNCEFHNNRSINQAGAVNSGNEKLSVTNCLFYENEAGTQAGAVYSFGPGAGSSTIINTTIVNNSAVNFGGGLMYEGSAGNLTMLNSIVVGNAATIGPDIFVNGGTLVANENNIIGDLSNSGFPSAFFVGYPAFVDSASNNYELQNNSPAIDAGDNVFLPADSCDIDADGDLLEQIDIDLHGDTRIHGCRVDIGAYENSDPGRILLVSNVNDAGLGSLRGAISCARSGDTIRFDASIDGDTIKVLTDLKVFNKTLVFEGNGVNQTIVDGSMNPNTQLFFSQFGGVFTLNDMTLQNQVGPFILTDNSTSNVTVNNCELHDATQGSFFGTILIIAGLMNLNNCKVFDNQNGDGTIVTAVASSIINVNQCEFFNNTSPLLIFNHNSPNAVLNIRQTTIFHEGTVFDNIDSLNLINNVIHSNATAGINNVAFGINQNNLINNPGDIPLGTTGNIEAYAEFADTSNADYSLMACSPGVNTGFDDGNIQATDLDGNNRVASWAVDRGAFEYGGSACPEGQCATPIAIECGVLYAGTTAQGGNFIDNYSCTADGESGPDIVHEIEVPVAGDITITLNDMSTGGEQDIDILLLSACDPDSCIDFAAASALIVTVSAGTYYLIVDGYDGGEPGTNPSFGAYEVTVDCPTAAGPCTEATVNVLHPINPMGIYHAINTLNSDATVNTTGVVFKAGQEINLTADFEVLLGNEFDATTEPCPPPFSGDESARASGRYSNEKIELQQRVKKQARRNK